MHTHYNENTHEWFSVGECENCEMPVKTANAVKAAPSEVDKLKALGVVFVDNTPSEEWFSNEAGLCVCERCDTFNGG